MTLPYDIARCQGATVQIPNERGGFPCTAFRRGCADCQRRTSPGRPGGQQTMMGPPPFVRGQCPERIESSVIPPIPPEIAGKNCGNR